MYGKTGGTEISNHRKSFHEEYNDVFNGRMELDDTDMTANIGSDGAGAEMSYDTISKQNELMSQALQYGQELRAEFKDDLRGETKKELEDTFALIAYPDARDSSLAPLLEASGRISVAEELSSAILGRWALQYGVGELCLLMYCSFSREIIELVSGTIGPTD